MAAVMAAELEVDACIGFTWSARIAVRSTLQSSTCGCALPVRLFASMSDYDRQTCRKCTPSLRWKN